MSIDVPKTSYSLKSVKDTIYWLSSEYTILLDSNDTHFIINCENYSEEFKKKFLIHLNDFSLRDIIHEETKEIKNLVTAKAFYPDLIKFKPIGEFEDPVEIEKNNAGTK